MQHGVVDRPMQRELFSIRWQVPIEFYIGHVDKEMTADVGT